MANKLQYAHGENISDVAPNSIGSGDLSITVNSISLWNSNGGPIIINRGQSDQEYAIASGISGSSLSISLRGAYGSTAVSHNANATIESVPFAHQWNDLITSLINVLVQSTGALDTTKVVDLSTAQVLTNKDLTGGTNTFPTSLVTLTGTQTLTNKRKTRRVVTITQSATPTINTDNTDVASITGLAQAITSMTTNLSGTPTDGDLLEVRITDNGTARGITWGSSFESTTVTLPTTTVISTMLRVGFEWNSTASKWDCIGIA